jgi:hypothetical protein
MGMLRATDHWRRTDAAADGLLVLPSVELNCLLPGARDGHVLGFGVEAEVDDLRGLAAEHADLARTADWIEAHGGVAYLAHPYWTGVVPGTVELPANVSGIEVYNAGCDLEAGRGLEVVHWDELLARGRLCPAIATDDSHRPGLDSDLAWTWVRARARLREAVLEALASGSFYASAGPVIHDISRDGDTLEVRCSPSWSVTLVCDRTIGAAVNSGWSEYRYGGELLGASDGLVVHARPELPVRARHARVEVTDAAGRRAWANPFPV